MARKVPTFFSILCMAAFLPFISTGCDKQCESADGCKRTCTCTDKANAVTFACDMIFNCDPESKTCDPMHGKSCDEICEAYASYNACGRQCEENAHCVLRCTCETQTGQLVCEQPYACDKKRGVCEEAHRTTTCEGLCQSAACSG